MKRQLKWLIILLALIILSLLFIDLANDKDKFILGAILIFSVVIWYIIFNTRYQCQMNHCKTKDKN